MSSPARRRSALVFVTLVVIVTAAASSFGSDPPPGAALLVRIGNAPRGKPIPSGFVGLSLEYSAIPAYAGSDPNSINPVLEQLIRNLSPGHQRCGLVATAPTGRGGRSPVSSVPAASGTR